MNNTAQHMAEIIMEKVREMVDGNTIIGESIITPAGVTIVPISKISVGFGLGGSKNPKNELKDNDKATEINAGGAGAGMSIVPVAFLTIVGENVRLITIDKNESTVDKALAMLPDLVDKAIVAFKGDKGCVEYV